MKKTVFLLSFITMTVLLGACGEKQSQKNTETADQKSTTTLTKKQASSSEQVAAAQASQADTQEVIRSTDLQQSSSSQTTTSSTQEESSQATELSIPSDILSAYRTAIKQAGLNSSDFSDKQLNGYYLEANKTGDVGTLFQFIARDRGMDVNQLLNSYYSYNGLNSNGSNSATMPASMLQAYRTAITQAGLDASSFTDEQLNAYYQQSHLSGDVGTLFGLIANDRGLDVNQLLSNYYQYNGQNSDGSADATMSETMLQAYRSVITQAGLDASSFTDDQLNSYYRQAHLTGDAGTLLQLIAKDRGLDFDQLLKTYQGQ